ncbi:MAG: outer membrane protein assembly factor BamD [candidate division NC10 bacterium]|nr:outer membrane protein assembly factor BamD [candidate division NC10 bacterium]
MDKCLFSLRGFLWILLVLSLSSCAGSRSALKERSEKELVLAAEQAFQRKKYHDAEKFLQQLLNQFPESPLQPEARLALGRVYFQWKKYEEARAEYLRFLELFPQHERADEARYFMGLSSFKQMNGQDRDQSFTRRALAEFQALPSEMPDSSYVKDAKAKAIICMKRLAEQELYVGTFYLRQAHYAAAISRFDTILKDYTGLGLDDQALYFKGEALLKLERKGEAREVFSRLLREYPGSRLARDAARRLGVPGPQVVGAEEPGMVSRLVQRFKASIDSLLGRASVEGE